MNMLTVFRLRSRQPECEAKQWELHHLDWNVFENIAIFTSIHFDVRKVDLEFWRVKNELLGIYFTSIQCPMSDVHK